MGMGNVHAASVIPPCAVTGIGSLPMHDPVAAVRLVAHYCPQLPFWPQLPQRSAHEGMIAQVLGPLDDLVFPLEDGIRYAVRAGCGDQVARRLQAGTVVLDAAHAAGFFAFEAALEQGMFADAACLKAQIVGPLTLAAMLLGAAPTPAEGVPLLEQDDMLEGVGHYITRMALWQIARLSRWKRPLLFFLDDPFVALVPLQAGDQPSGPLRVVQRTVAALRAAGVLVGLHCCATTAIAAAMSRTGADVLSFDAYNALEDFFADAEGRAFVQQGGVVAAGLVPTWDDVRGLAAATLAARWQAAAGAVVGDRAALARQTIVTAACGLGLKREAAARDSFALAQEVAELLRC